MKRFACSLTAGVLAVGSIAVAQPELIVDPWGASGAAVKDPVTGFRVIQHSYAFRGSSDVIVDPWRGALPGATQANAALAARDASARAHVWPPAGEIIDPWPSSERPRASPRFDALIVDPWAR